MRFKEKGTENLEWKDIHLVKEYTLANDQADLRNKCCLHLMLGHYTHLELRENQCQDDSEGRNYRFFCAKTNGFRLNILFLG